MHRAYELIGMLSMECKCSLRVFGATKGGAATSQAQCADALTCEWANDELESQSDEFDANRDELELDVCEAFEAIEPLSSVSLWFSAATEYSSDS